MNTLFKIAWRSLWRNKRRTIITSASVFLAVFLALFMRSMQIGSYEMMIDSAVNEAGHIQIHKKGFWEKKSINYFLEYNADLKTQIDQYENTSIAIPRIESFALASYGERTKGVAVQGIIPEITDQRTKLGSKIIEGRYLRDDDQGVLIAEGLAKYLRIGVSDSIVLLGQGYQGITVAAIFPVVGIVKFPIPKLNNLMLYLELSKAQEILAPYNLNLISALVIELKDDHDLSADVSVLKEIVGDKYEVMSWEEMLTEVVSQIKGDNAGGIVMLAILYLIVAFGIFSTVLMMTTERKREFAIMVAIGLHRGKLAVIVFLETILIGLLGVVAGIIASIPVLQFFHYNPIPLTGETANMMLEYNIEPVMPFSLETYIFTNQGITVMILAFLTALYPIIFVNRFRLIKAMRK